VLNTERARGIVRLYRSADFDWGHRNFDRLNDVILLFLSCAKVGVSSEDIELFEDAVDVMLAWDNDFDRWAAQRKISAWLPSLDNGHARIFARLLRKYPESREHFAHVAEDRSVSRRIRAAVGAPE
jgi:hypothetical protein